MPYREQSEVEVTDEVPKLYPYQSVLRCVYCGVPGTHMTVTNACAANCDDAPLVGAAHIHVRCRDCSGAWIAETYATFAARPKWGPWRVIAAVLGVCVFTALITWLWTGWPS